MIKIKDNVKRGWGNGKEINIFYKIMFILIHPSLTRFYI